MLPNANLDSLIFSKAKKNFRRKHYQCYEGKKKLNVSAVSIMNQMCVIIEFSVDIIMNNNIIYRITKYVISSFLFFYR